MAEPPARKRLLGILAGSWTAQGIYALVRLGIPELLADGPRPATELADECAADPQALTRLLRALALTGLVAQPSPGVFGLTATSELLRADVPGSVRLNALMQGDEVFRAFAEIMHTMRNGRPSFEHVFGKPFYDYLDDNPDAAAIFNESMGDQRPPEALTGCDLSGAEHVIDVGGGNGVLLEALLTEHPGLRGTLVELPDACRLATERFTAAGVADRAEVVAGSFFDGVPAGGDVYVLARVLHNWADERAHEILRNCRAAMATGARLIVLEEFTPGFVDLLMLVTMEGRDRTADEYGELLGKAGFEVTAVRDGVLEARAA
ncbi:hypothetical protein F4553_006022 [Allocatelliglobosispora scoriae]|uniref:Methyltransferase n=1 Tax=Allocatelliglobosispora scoriae TaxID=643052 RepID=A0A841BYM6_9ACTN|nr:methyltransferase [Allocatelliglobosispora scoriae]MBB5872588.1 hypothetical protein [Allocatelliglobosispora scoriae]